MQVPVLKDALRDHRGAFGLGHESHVLGLHVGGEAGILLRDRVRGAQRSGALDLQQVPDVPA